MEIKKYEKLVRSRIPEIIKTNGSTPITEMVENRELAISLKAKLIEEALEVRDCEAFDEVAEELADVQEVLDSLRRIYGITKDQLKTVQDSKRIKRGPFIEVGDTGKFEGIILKEVHSEN